MIEFQNLKITNFISVKSASISLDTLGLCLVKGANGSGKSNLFKKALLFNLFGSMPEKIRVDDLSSDYSTEDLSVISYLNVDGKEVSIGRYRNHKIHQNKIRLLIEGEDVSSTDNRETQKQINQLLGLDYTVFINSIMFSSGVPLFAESTEANRSSLLTNVLNLRVYDKALKKVKVELSEEKAKLNQLCDKYKWTQNSIESNNTLITEIEETKGQFIIERDAAILKKSNEIKDLSEQCARCERILESNQVSSDTLDKLEESIKEGSNKYEKLRKEAYKIDNDIKHLDSDLIILRHNKCDVCRQPITEEYAKKETSRINKLISKKNLLLKQTNIEMSKLMNEHTELVSKHAELIESSSLYKSTKERLYNLNIRINELHADRVSLERTTYSDDGTLRTLLERNKSNEIALENLNTGMSIISEKINNLEFWEKGFSRQGIPNLLIENSLDGIQENVNKYLSGSGISVELSGQKQLKSGEFRESIDIIIRNNGLVRNYNQLSAGEKKRIDIAFLFAIADVSPIKSNIMVLDEALDLSLDGDGVSMVMDILIKKSSELDSLVVISHKEELKELFQNVLTVVKDNGISNIVGGENGRRIQTESGSSHTENNEGG